MLAEAQHETQISIETTGSVRRLTETRELVLFRSAQEAILNARRHGKALKVSVQVAFQPTQVLLTVQDDGIGFKTPIELSVLAIQGHYGLIGIHERLQYLDGTLTFSSQMGVGTCVEITIPLAHDMQPNGLARDPVCSTLVAPQQAYGSFEYDGDRYYFCCPVCQGAFQKNPTVYIEK